MEIIFLKMNTVSSVNLFVAHAACLSTAGWLKDYWKMLSTRNFILSKTAEM